MGITFINNATLTFSMKIVLSTTIFLIAVLAIDILGINNSAFAQSDEKMVKENETGLMNSTEIMNATLPTSIISNATLAYAQEGFQT